MAVADEIETLNREIRGCTRCRLARMRIHALCGEGPPDARLFLIAQAPGRVEDREGRMFIGPSGKIFDALLGLAAVDRDRVYMSNLVKCIDENIKEVLVRNYRLLGELYSEVMRPGMPNPRRVPFLKR